MCVIIQAIWKKAVWRCEARMHRLGKWMRALALVGQLGFCIITPPLVLIWLAKLAQDRLGWGAWVMLAAIVVGLITGLTSVWRLIRGFTKSEEKKTPKGRGFNDHI